MKKLLILIMMGLLLTGCGEKNVQTNSNNESPEYTEENELKGNYKKVPMLLGYDSNDTIEITYDAERFHVEEYYSEEPQEFIYVDDMTNGKQISITISDLGISTDDYYDKLVSTAKKNANADDFKATKMEDVKYGGITFKKFSVSWSKAYEYNEKETGNLVSGISKNDEIALFAEIKSGVFLVYEGPVEEDVLNSLFVKIKK